MSKDMENGEIRECNGKKYKYIEIEAMETDINWSETCCKGCSLAVRGFCEKDEFILGNCYEEHREDGRNGIFVEVEEG